MFSILSTNLAFQKELFGANFRRVVSDCIYLLIIQFRLMAKLTAVAHCDFPLNLQFQYSIIILQRKLNLGVREIKYLVRLKSTNTGSFLSLVCFHQGLILKFSIIFIILMGQSSLKQTQSGLNVSQQKTQDHDYLAYLFQVLSCTIFPLSYIYTNQHKFSPFQVQIGTALGGIPLNYIFIRYQGANIKFEDPKYFSFLLKLNIWIILYLFTLPFSQKYLPLPIVHTIGCTSIVSVYIMDYFINKTTITRIGLVGIIIGFLGVILMANNRAVNKFINLADDFETTYTNYQSQSVLVCSLVAIFLLIARTFNSYSLVIIKKHPEITIFQINFHRCVLSLFIASIGYFTSQSHISLVQLGISIITVGVSQFICFGMFLYSLKLTKKTGNLMILNTSNVLVAFLISYFRYDEKVNPIIIIGSSALFISILIVVGQTKKQKQKTLVEQEKKVIENSEG